MCATGGIQAFLFDFGGVMAGFYRPDVFHQMEHRLGLPAHSLSEILWNSPDWHLAEVGAITDGEYWHRIRACLGLKTEEAFRDFQQTLFADVRPDPLMVELVRRLRGKYTVGLLSNAADSLPRLLQEQRLDGLFDVQVISALVHLAKPDPAIFRLALERLGARPEATVFVDDHAPNVAAAAALGIHAIRFTDHGALVERLQAMGVL
jgi:putative hydrolase of the HAD superfamily